MRGGEPVPGKKHLPVMHPVAVEVEHKPGEPPGKVQVQRVKPLPRVGAVVGKVVRRRDENGPVCQNEKQEARFGAVGPEGEPPEGKRGEGLGAPGPPHRRPGNGFRERLQDARSSAPARRDWRSINRRQRGRGSRAAGPLKRSRRYNPPQRFRK